MQMFYRKVIRQIVFGKKKTTDEMEIGESDQSEALGVVLHSDHLNTHSMPSVSVALLVETDMIVYKSRGKQLRKAVETASNQHHNAHQKAPSLEAMCYSVPVCPRRVMVFSSRWWLSEVGVIELCTMGRVG